MFAPNPFKRIQKYICKCVGGQTLVKENIGVFGTNFNHLNQLKEPLRVINLKHTVNLLDGVFATTRVNNCSPLTYLDLL